MAFYHVISDIPKYTGERFFMDRQHPNGVYKRVYEQIDTVKDIYRNPVRYSNTPLSHEVRVALRELAMEKIRKEKYPHLPSRLASLYVTTSMEAAIQWAHYFSSLGRPVYGIALVETNGSSFFGDASKCFDGTIYEEENLRMAEAYWKNESNADGYPSIPEILLDGEITIIKVEKTCIARK